jgi:hypothetical protein
MLSCALMACISSGAMRHRGSSADDTVNCDIVFLGVPLELLGLLLKRRGKSSQRRGERRDIGTDVP